MKKLLAMALVGGALLSPIVLKADASTAQYVLDAALLKDDTQGSTVLRLAIEDAKPKSGVCPYYVKTTEYLPSLHVLNVEVYQENCRNEAFGTSKGQVYWVVPKSLQDEQVELQVLVNQKISGTLNYSPRFKTFIVKSN
jgi:hypothetical protein